MEHGFRGNGKENGNYSSILGVYRGNESLSVADLGANFHSGYWGTKRTNVTPSRVHSCEFRYVDRQAGRWAGR